MNAKKHKKRIIRVSGIIAVVALAFAVFHMQTANAAVRLWTGAGGDSNFSTAGNWSGGVVPQNGDSLVFDEAILPVDGNTSRVVVNNDISGLVLTGISFINFNDDAQGYEVAGNDITISGAIETDDLFYDEPGFGEYSTANLVSTNLTLDGDLAIYNVPIGTNSGTRTLSMGAYTLEFSTSDADYSAYGIKSNIIGTGLIHFVSNGPLAMHRASLNGDNSAFTGEILIEEEASVVIGPSSAPNATLLTSYGTLTLGDLDLMETLIDISTPMALSGNLNAENGVSCWTGGSCGDSGAGADYVLSGGVELLGDVTYTGRDDYTPNPTDTYIEAPFRPHQYTITDNISTGYNGVVTSDAPINDTAPDAPTGLNATPSSTQIALTWTAPVNDGGGAITDYQVQYKLSTDLSWTTFADGTSTATNATITGLSNGVNYDVRVAAVNWVGAGSYVTSSNVAMPASAPGAPTGLGAVPSAGQVALTWNAPASDGNDAITDYVVEYKRSVDSSWTNFAHAASSATSRTVTGLDDGETYDFRVAAVNGIGTSTYATVNNVSLNALVATAPQSLNVTAGVASADLSWTAPADDGGSAITDYVIEYKESSAGSWSNFAHTASTATTATISGLSNGITYDFRVAAVNGAGTSSYVTESGILIPAVAASAPQNLLATPAVGEVALDWDAPADNGGASITDYAVEYKLSADSSWTVFAHTASGVTARTVTGLANGQSYDFRVAAVNAAGTGAATAINGITVTATVAGAPLNIVATPAVDQVGLAWDAPASNGGSAITDYLIEYKLSADSSWTVFAHTASTATGATITGLLESSSYDFRVSAVNGTGTGSSVSALGVTTQSAVTAPSAPSDLEVYLNGSQQVTLEWTAPVSNGGSAITNYLIEYSIAGANDWQLVTGTTATIYTFTSGLAEGQTYDFRVSAQNSAGSGSSDGVSGFAFVVTPGSGGSGGGNGSGGGSGNGGGSGSGGITIPLVPNSASLFIQQNLALVMIGTLFAVIALGWMIRSAKKRA